MYLTGLLLGLLLSAISCSAHKGPRAAGSQTVTLQPWLVGLTAVVGFLFILFIILIVHRLLRKDRKEEEDGVYENQALEADAGDVKQTSL